MGFMDLLRGGQGEGDIVGHQFGWEVLALKPTQGFYGVLSLLLLFEGFPG